MKTVVGLFDDFQEAQGATEDLVQAGIARNDISLVASNEGGRYDQHLAANPDATTPSTSSAVGKDATAGAVVGGVAGLLMGLGLFVIPGFGPVVAAGWLVSTLTGAGIGAALGGLVGALTHVGVPHEDAVNYNESVRRGGTLIAVKAPDELAQEVAQILSNHGAVNIDERAEQYRREGFVPTPAPMATATTAPVAMATTTQMPQPIVDQSVQHEIRTNTEPITARVNETAPTLVERADETRVPIVEEQLQVGKREVQRGGVRVYTHVEQRPVEENVTLREEKVTVERHPVNRPASEAEFNTVREGTVEITETVEEPVIAKQARVVEEVVVGKQASERVETVRDTVRRTDVDVEQLDREHIRRNVDSGTWESEFQNNFRSNYANSGMTYEQYSPAYRYGYDMSTDPQYAGQEWNTIEPKLRANWETRQPGTWDRFSNAIRFAWDKATGAERGGIQTGGRALDGTPDTRGITEKVADAVTGDRVDDKTGKLV